MTGPMCTADDDEDRQRPEFAEEITNKEEDPMSHITSAPTINLAGGARIDITSYGPGILPDGLITVEFNPSSTTNGTWIAHRFSPGVCAELGAALIAAAKSTGWVESFEEVEAVG